MRSLLLLCMLAFSSPSFGSGPTWWGDFCEKYIAGFDHGDEIVDMRFKSASEAEYDIKLISEYRRTGGILYMRGFDRGKRAYLRELGDEMRFRGIGAEAFEDYGRFEK